jgi:hypothetical protein
MKSAQDPSRGLRSGVSSVSDGARLAFLSSRSCVRIAHAWQAAHGQRFNRVGGWVRQEMAFSRDRTQGA